MSIHNEGRQALIEQLYHAKDARKNAAQAIERTEQDFKRAAKAFTEAQQSYEDADTRVKNFEATIALIEGQMEL